MEIKNMSKTINKKDRRTSKFIREYGATMHTLADKYNVNPSYIWILHLKGDLHEFIKQQATKQKEESNIEEGIERSRKLADEILERHGK